MRSTGSDRLKNAGEIALTGLQTTLQVAKDASSATGVPGLAAGIAGLATILDAVQQTTDNAESANRLVERVVELDKMLRSAITTRTIPQTTLMRVLQLLKKWENEGDEIKKLRSRSRMRRFLGSKNDAKAVAGHLEAIDQSIRDFMLESTFRTELDIRGLRDDRQAHDVNVLFGFDVNLPHSKAAHFDYSYNNISRTGCMDGTRTEILQKLDQWINTQHTTGESARIFWINGMAGTGKTTIAYTVSKYCRDSGTPLATFFCSRDSAEASNPNLVFPTIARQLGIINEAFAQELSNSFRTHPDTVYSAISHQLEMLLVKPLNAAKDQFPHCVVVLDALDECKDDSSTSIILSSLSHHITKLPSAIQFLITSRPEPSIAQGFRQRVLHTVTQSFNLHEEALGTVEKDIELYLKESLHSTRDDYELEDSWPSTPDIKSLVGLSEGLFIYAATAVKFIGDASYDHPKDQLQRLLNNQGGTRGSLTLRLDELYMQILGVALKNIAAERQDLVKLVLSSIVLLRDPLSSSDLEQLLILEPGTVKRALRRLRSALDVPEEDDIRVIRLIHPSFHDFMVDASRCTIPRFAIIPDDHHEVLARACLDALMKGLRRNICDLQDPSKLNSEVGDIQDRIASRIALHLQYACRHWMWHACRSRVTNVLLQMMHDFVHTKLLYWIEVCSLLGELRTALVGLNEVQGWLATSGGEISDTTELLYDGERLIREFFPVLSTASLHTYYSALVWTPFKSLLRATYEHELVDVVELIDSSLYQWSRCLQTLEGHSRIVYSVSFSHDGTKIISGSADCTIRLWDAVTGALLKIFRGHRGGVNAVAMSFDDSSIISCSKDLTIRVWDISTGAQLRILEPHSRWAIATSMKDNWVASSADNNIQVWDFLNGVLLRTLRGHKNFVSCVTFSEDGKWIVSGGTDLQVRVWQAESGTLRATLTGHEASVSAVTCSPNGKIIISGSPDCTARVWDAETGSLLLIKTFDYGVVSIVFNPLTNEVTCAGGAHGNQIKIWDLATGDLLRTLEARDSGKQSLAISKNGMRLASGGGDKKIRVWHTQTASSAQETEHILEVDLVKFSPDGLRIVSAANHRLYIWDACTCTILRTLEGHELDVVTASFSLDSTQLLSGSDDKTIRLWDVETGITLTCLKGHGGSIQYAEFFRDGGTRIISRSMDGTIRIWDTTVGNTVQIITAIDPNYPLYTALSPSGDQLAVAVKKVVQIWNLDGGGLQKTLEGHQSTVKALIFSADSTKIFTSSYDGTVRMWDAATGIEMKAFETGGTPRQLMFSPDEKFLFTSFGPIAIPKDLSIKNSEDAVRVPSASDVGYFIKSGWLCTQHPMRRVCWIPPAWRPREALASDRYPLSWYGNRVVFGTVNGVVFLDTTDAVAELLRV